MALEHPTSAPFLICRCGARLCGLPLEYVAETMRPLPVETFPDMPPALLGVAVIRAVAVPVVDVAMLIGATTRTPPGRYVTLKLGGERQVGLAVESVIGVRELAIESLNEVPPLLSDAAPDVISAVTLLDAELVLVLQAARLIPDSVWDDIDVEVSSS